MFFFHSDLFILHHFPQLVSLFCWPFQYSCSFTCYNLSITMLQNSSLFCAFVSVQYSLRLLLLVPFKVCHFNLPLIHSLFSFKNFKDRYPSVCLMLYTFFPRPLNNHHCPLSCIFSPFVIFSFICFPLYKSKSDIIIQVSKCLVFLSLY